VEVDVVQQPLLPILVDEIIEPAETRRYLALALESLHGKRELRPAKKHGLIPL